MAETGFGSLSFNPLPEYNDWGFGSPTPVVLGDEKPVDGNVEYSTPDLQSILTEADYVDRQIDLERDTAFGSPFDNFNHPVVLQGDGALIPDDGGINIKLQSRWTSVWNNEIGRKFRLGKGFLGPFYVTYINKATGQVTSAVGGRCFTNYSMDTLYAGVPPLPRGDYNVEIKWQDINTVRIVDAFSVVVRPRIPEAYNLRMHIPSHLSRGPTVLKNDYIGVYYKDKESNLSVLLKSLGERLQDFIGKPTTGLAASLSWGDATVSVETTLGFPDSGILMIAGHKISYTGKTATSFTGIDYLNSYWPDYYAIKEEVTCDVTAIK